MHIRLHLFLILQFTTMLTFGLASELRFNGGRFECSTGRATRQAGSMKNGDELDGLQV
jgi:hypothetical protein